MQRFSILVTTYFTAKTQKNKHLLKTITCISYITLLLCFFPTTYIKAQTPYQQSFVDIEIFSKEPGLNYICIKDLQQLNLKTTKNKYCLKASNNKLLKILPSTPGSQLVEHKLTLYNENGLPVCISNNKIDTRCYTGIIKVIAKNNKLKLINRLRITDYLHSVVGSELPEEWPEEAVKAQTIVAHSYLLYLLNNNSEIKDTTQSQFYGGIKFVKPQYNDYIKEVKDIILVDKNNNPIEALFHSTCAGKTLNNESVFGGNAINYLRETKCKYDQESNFYKQKVSYISEKKLKKKLQAKIILPIYNEKGELVNIKIDNKLLNPYQFWLKIGQQFGWGVIPGIKYNIKISKDHWQIISRGAGHSVGLCQWGSRGMAKKGFNYQDILRYYYKNVFFSVLDRKTNKFKRFQAG